MLSYSLLVLVSSLFAPLHLSAEDRSQLGKGMLLRVVTVKELRYDYACI